MLSARAKRKGGHPLDAPETPAMVGKDHLVRAVLLVEEVRDTQVLGEARNEGQIGLAVLHDKLARRVLVEEAEVNVSTGEADQRELLLDDVGHREVEEDLLELDEGQPMEAWHEPHPVRRVCGLGVEQVDERREHPVDRADLDAVTLEDQGNRRTKNFLGIEGIGVGRDQVDIEPERLRDGFPPDETTNMHAGDVEVLGLEAERAVGLRGRHRE